MTIKRFVLYTLLLLSIASCQTDSLFEDFSDDNSTKDNLLHDYPANDGVRCALEKARLVAGIEWTPITNIPSVYSNPYLSGITQKVLNNKPTKEEVEKKLIQRCDERLNKISDEIRRHEHKTPDLLISILADALRNLDGIEDIQLKARVYDTIIRDSLIFTVVTKETLADYANRHEGKLPPAFSDVKNVPFFFRYMPWAFQRYLYNIMGTTKLTMIFRDKFDRDMHGNCSDIERFMTAGLLWDCINLGSFDEMKRLIKKVGKNVTKDYIFLKLLYHYNNRVLSGSEQEQEYIKLFAALEAKDKFIPFVEQKRIEQKAKNKR